MNGRWPESCAVSVYRINGQNPNGLLISASDYAINSSEGRITFFNAQSSTDSFIICVEFQPFVRLISKIDNSGNEGAIIHHIGLMYNIMKRIPYDSDGSIIHKTISVRLT